MTTDNLHKKATGVRDILSSGLAENCCGPASGPFPRLIYIAAPYSEKLTARIMARTLESVGCIITSFWHEQQEEPPSYMHQRLALADIEAVKRSHMVICFQPNNSTTGALHQEIGIAQGCGIPIAVIAGEEPDNLLLQATTNVNSLQPRGYRVLEELEKPMRHENRRAWDNFYLAQEENARQSNNLACAEAEIADLKAKLAARSKAKPRSTAKRKAGRK